MNQNALTLYNLSKTYFKKGSFFRQNEERAHVALDNFSCSLTNGLYGLLGPNGAGKTTLINIVVGTLLQDEGLVMWNGKSISQLGIQYRRILGFMPQQQTLYDNYTGRRFLSYIAALKEIPKKNVSVEIEKAAGYVNLIDELDKKLSAYSGGMKQRLLAAAALIGSPKLLIMDEPTAGLDPKERVHLRRTLSTISQDSIVVIATHVVSDIEDVANEILILKEGILFDKDSPQALINKYAPGKDLESVYLNIFGSEQ